MKKARKIIPVPRWKPGWKVGLIHLTFKWEDQSKTTFQYINELRKNLDAGVAAVPQTSMNSLEIIAFVEVYAQNGGLRRRVLGRWKSGNSKDKFVDMVKELYDSIPTAGSPGQNYIEVPVEFPEGS